MKQKITHKQLKELDDKQLAVWEGWRNEKWHDSQISPRPNIGSMIDFLNWHLQFPKIIIDEDQCGCEHCSTRYKLEFYVNPEQSSNGTYKASYSERWQIVEEELCDALWEAVKRVIKGRYD